MRTYIYIPNLGHNSNWSRRYWIHKMGFFGKKHLGNGYGGFHSFYYLKIFAPAAGFYYFQFFWAHILTSEKSIFRQKSRFCLVKHPKNFRLRRAKNARFLLTSWKFFRLRRALIILKFLSQNFRGSYYSQNFILKFSKFLLFLEEGGFIIN